MKTSVFIATLTLGLFLTASAHGDDPSKAVWDSDTLVISWGGLSAAPRVSLLPEAEVTDETLSKATPLTGQRFVWEDREIPGVWVFYLPEQMRGEYFFISLLKPGKLVGAGSNTFRAEKAIMVTRMVKAPKRRDQRVTRLNANGVVGQLYVLDPTETKCFGLSEDCKILRRDAEAAEGKK